jgi:hypothetical protein
MPCLFMHFPFTGRCSILLFPTVPFSSLAEIVFGILHRYGTGYSEIEYLQSTRHVAINKLKNLYQNTEQRKLF